MRPRALDCHASHLLDFLHVAVDAHSRYACVEALPRERGFTCAAFLTRALADFSRRRVLTDNAKSYTAPPDGSWTVQARGPHPSSARSPWSRSRTLSRTLRPQFGPDC